MQHEETILIVDDDSTHRFMLAHVIASWGYVTSEAADGAAAVEMIRRSGFSLVLMDVRMNGLSGLDALATIRAFDLCIPVILMSAYWSGELIGQARKHGANAVLEKPLSLGNLRKTIELALVQRCRPIIENGRNLSINLPNG
jgi:two-component system response regulator HydG